MRLVRELDTRRGRLALAGLAAGFVIYAALALSGALGGGANKAQLEQDLADARLMATMAPVIADAHTAFQGDAGMEGSPLPGALIERLKESYTLVNEERDADKTRLSAASATALAGKMSIDSGSAEFIVAAGLAEDWDTLAGLNRNLFDEYRATLQALIYSEVSKVASESGIGKLDSVKVEAPRLVRGRAVKKRKPKPPKADVNSVRELKEHMDRARGALGAAAPDALVDALAAAVSLAEIDPSVRSTARAGLVRLLEHESLSDEQTARIRMAALGSQPDINRAVRQILGAHLREALHAIPAPPASPDDDDSDEAGDDEEGEREEGDREAGEGGESLDNGRETEADNNDEGDAESDTDADAKSDVEADAAADEDTGKIDGPEAADDAGDVADDGEEDASAVEEADADDGDPAAEELPPYNDDPVVFHAAPFPELPALPASTQRRLLTALSESGGWLSDDQINDVLSPPEPPPAKDPAGDGDGDGDSDGDGDGDSDGDGDGDSNGDDRGDADEQAREAEAVDAEPEDPDDGAGEANTVADSDEAGHPEDEGSDDSDVHAADEEAEGAGPTDDGDGEDSAGSGGSDGDADGHADDGEAGAETEEAVPAEAHPDAPTVRAYQAALVETLWQVADLLRRRPPTVGETYTASVAFKAPLDQLVNFVHKLETQKPWIRVIGIRIGIDNADQPMLGLTLSLEANIL